VLHARERYSAGRAIPCKAIALAHSQLLAPSAMGLMMGALWLGDAWCAGLGWSPEHMVWAHLGLMAGLPAVVALSLRGLPDGSGLSVHHAHIGAALMVLGALMLLGNSALHGLLAMGLPSLAWALHCARHGMVPVTQAPGARVWPVWTLRCGTGAPKVNNCPCGSYWEVRKVKCLFTPPRAGGCIFRPKPWSIKPCKPKPMVSKVPKSKLAVLTLAKM
jgi:hypothetical protein